ncbi:MAG: hypothetical protein IM638_04060 [Bacteroidetes bacterium]|nr:hypothetical protein [Bacteroidota bacterium]
MKATDDLHRLLHSLTQAEKRYVKIFASRHLIGEQNNYMLLFDAVLDQDEYNEDKLKAKLKTRHLSSEKNYLFRFVLKSMRTFHAEKNVDKQLKESLLDIRFLIDKRIYDVAVKELEKVKKLAYEFDKFLVLIEVFALERAIVTEKQTKEVRKKIHEINEETRKVLDKLVEWQNGAMLQNDIFLYQRNRATYSPETLKELDRLIENPFFQKEPDSNSFELSFSYLFAKSIYYQQCNDFIKAHNYQLRLIQLWDRFPQYVQEESLRFKKMLSNYLSICMRIDRFEEFPATLERIRSIPCDSAEEEAEQFQNVYFFEFLYHMNLAQFDEAEALIPEIEKGMKKYKTKINKARELTFYSNISTLLFIKSNYKGAYEWLNKIIQDGKSDSRQDVQHYAKIHQLVLLFELGKYDLLEYTFRSVQRHIKQSEISLGYEDVLLQTLRKLVDVHENERLPVYNKFYDKLVEIRKEKKGFSTGLDEIQIWVKHHIQDKPMTEILSEMVLSANQKELQN